MRKWIGMLAVCALSMAHGDELVPHETLEQELTRAEREFAIAEKMFDPYYTGPLLAPGVTIPAPGHVTIQPYLFLTDTYGRYNNEGHGERIDSIYSARGTFLAFIGFTKWLGLQVAVGYSGNWQRGRHGNGWDDPSLTLLIPFLKETPYIPGMLLGIRETFPAGRYQNLNPDRRGLDATGDGAYRTSFFYNIAKIFWNYPTHPMRLRLATQYTLPYRVHVRNFNSFGGGFCTDARVRLPFAFYGDLGYEFSFTQRWVASLDVVYTYNQKVTFTGFPGFQNPCSCELANVGGSFGDNLSLAPAIEYNVDAKSGFIVGPWFSVWGRNSGQFVSLVASFYYGW